MTFEYPDVSQYTPVDLAGAPVVFARATIGLARDTHYATFVANAAARGVPLGAYHFLNSGRLGASPEAQADFAFSVIGARATMLDHEPNRGYCATFDEGMRFVGRYRANGGVLHLDYLPHWSWQGWMGSPSLTPLHDAGIRLVTSNYGTYSDSGPGWAPYGGLAADDIAAWQYADNHSFNGVAVDWNTVKRPLADFLAMMNGGTEMALKDDPDWVAFVNRFNAMYQGSLADKANVAPRVWRALAGLDPEAPWPETTPGSNVVDWSKVPNTRQVLGAVSQLTAALQAASAGGITPDIVDALATALASKLVISPGNGLTIADHAAVKADLAEVLTEELGQIRLTTGA
jgi:hypothetical protein